MSTSGSVRPPGGPRTEHATGVTNSAGSVTFTWPEGAFTAPPVVSLAVQAGPGFRSATVTANTATATTVTVQQSSGVTLLGIGVLAVGTAASGVTVHAIAREA